MHLCGVKEREGLVGAGEVDGEGEGGGSVGWLRREKEKNVLT